MQNRILFTALAMLSVFQACKNKQPGRPKEFYENMQIEDHPSTLNLPIRISKAELEKNINDQLGEVLFEDNDMRGDGLAIKATRHGDISLKVEGQRVAYLVPVDLWVKKDLGITTVSGEGALSIELATDFDIRPDWDFQTNTELVKYEWTKTPVVRTPLGSLNVTGIADQFIGQFRGEITSTIDRELRSVLDLKKEVGKAWKELQKPFPLSDEYATSLIINPTSVGMTPLRTTDGQIESTVVISALPKLFMGENTEAKNTSQLPDFQRLESAENEDFAISLSSAIPFGEAQRIAKQNMLGETYTFGSRSVKVEDVELYGQGNKMVVKTKLSGSYSGDVYLIGKPKFNVRKNQIELEDVEFDFSSKKALMRSAAWLFKGSFKRKIQDELDFHLTQNLASTKEAIQKELERFQLAPGMELKGNLSELNVSEVFIGADAIHVRVGLNGQLNLAIGGG